VGVPEVVQEPAVYYHWCGLHSDSC